MPRVLEERKPEPKVEKTSLIPIISAVVLIIGVGVSLASSSQAISREAFLLLSAALLLVAIVLSASALYQPLIRYWAKRQSTGREDRISRESLENFQSFVERLGKISTGQYMDTILHPLQTLKAQGGFSTLPEMVPWINSVNSLIFQVAGLFDRVGVNRHTFVWAVDTFTTVLGLFNDGLNRIVNEALLIAEQKPVPRLVREEYNTYRDSYNRFLDDYSIFVVQLNKRFRSYELTIPLPGGQSTTTTEYAFRSVYAERPKEL